MESTNQTQIMNSFCAYNGKIYALGQNATTMMEIYTPANDRLYILLDIGEKAQLSMSHDLGVNQHYIWTSDNEAVATVNSNGVITAISEGICKIFVRNSDGYEEYTLVKVVGAQRLALHLNKGESKRLWLTDDPLMVTWTSDPTIASVDVAGCVTGVAKGFCVAKGELDGVEHYIYIRVNA